jgi:glutamate-1-semialdehyde 2,1-aminomutase
VQHVRKLGYACEQGSETDVLDRFVQAARRHEADVVVRITGDCPLVDPGLVEECVRRFKATDVDYISNVDPPTFPDGLDIEVFSFGALEQAGKEASTPQDREHVTPYLRKSGRFRTASIRNDEDLSAFRWTVDEPADLEVIGMVFQHFHPRTDFAWRDVLALQQRDSSIFSRNSNFSRNEGARMGTGQKLWNRAKRVIPGGGMLLSKRAEMFLPEQWPKAAVSGIWTAGNMSTCPSWG